MIALRNTHFRPGGNDCRGVRRAVCINEPRYVGLSGINSVTALSSPFAKRFGSNVGCTNGKKVFGKLALGTGKACSSVVKFNAACCPNRFNAFEGLQSNGFNVRVKKVAHDGRAVGAAAGGKSTAACVNGVSSVFVSSTVWCASAHDAAACNAPSKASKQGGFSVRSWLACANGSLGTVKHFLSNDWWVRRWVCVRANRQFTKVNTVAENVAGTSDGYAKLCSKFSHWFTSYGVFESFLERFGFFVGHQASRVWVFVVAVGNDCALPYASFCRGCALRVKTFAVKVKFVFGYCGKHGACEAAGGGAGVNVFGYGNDLAAGGFNSIPELQQVRNGSRCARQVRDDKAAVFAAFNAFNGFAKDWSVAVTAAGVKLGRKDNYLLVSVASPSFDCGCLVVGGSKTVSIAAPHMTYTNVTNPRLCHCKHDTGLTSAVNYQSSLAPNKGRARV